MKNRSGWLVADLNLGMVAVFLLAIQVAGIASAQANAKDLWRWSGGLAWKEPELSDVRTVAVGDTHIVALAGPAGRVYTAGDNNSGQLGDGTTVKRLYPMLAVTGISNIVGVAVGKGYYGFNIAWQAGGSVWAWGANDSGQLGDGTTTNRLRPVRLVGISDIIAAACGEAHTLALRADGSVWSWGGNWYGQLGDGTTTGRLTPVWVSGLTGCVAVAAGNGGGGMDASLAVANDGSLWGWGANANGQLGNGTTTGGLTPQRIPGISNVVDVSTAAGHTLALKADGTVWACGANQYGQLGDGTTVSRLSFVRVPDLSGVVQVVACDSYSLALKADGSVWGWGSGYSTGSPVRVQMMGNTPFDRVSAIAAGGYDRAGLDNGGCYGLRSHAGDAPAAFNQSLVCGNDRSTKISLSYADRDSRPYEMSISVVAPPTRGRIVVAYGPNVYYEPEPGFEGQVSFSWKISDGVSTSATAVCTLAVASTPPGGTNRIALIVNPNVYASLSNELARLKNDLMWDRKDVIILVQAYGTNDLAMYAYLKDQYVNHQLQGAILVGAQPEAVHAAGILDPDAACDNSYVNMREYIYMANSQLADIWVTRLRAYNLMYPPAGGEVGLLRRALDANHYYRTGKLRYPHRVHWGEMINSAGWNSYDMQQMRWRYSDYYAQWPEVLERAPVDGLSQGCNFDYQGEHGNATSGGGITTSTAYHNIFRANIFNGSSCSGDVYENPMHQQLFTKHGGLVLSLNGNSTYWWEGRRLDQFYPIQDMLLQGASMGDAILADKRQGFWGSRFNGDLSVRIMQAPPNAMPVVTSLTASKLQVLPGEPVTFAFTMSDPDGTGPKSPYLPFRHKVEWYMNGWDYGRKDPTYIADNTQANWTQKTHTFNAPGTYVVRVLVMDEWRAVAWKEITILVNSAPVAVNDAVTVMAGYSTNIYVLANDTDPDGQVLTLNKVTTAPRHGRLDISGNTIMYTATNATWIGTDSFVYQVKDTLSVMSSATVTMTVVAPPAGAQNNVPTVKNQSVTTMEETPTTFTLNATDADGDTLTRVMVKNPGNGSLSGTGVNVTYTPKANFKGADSFTYRMYDGKAYSAVATVSITVVNVNDPPTVTMSATPTSGTAPLLVAFNATGSDPDGDTLAYSWTFGDGSTYTGKTPMEGWGYGHTYQSSGVYIATVTVSDGKGGTGSASRTITVTSTSGNQTPVITEGASAAVTMSEDNAPTAFGLTLHATDAEANTLTWSISTAAAHGTATASGTGASKAIGYTPAANYVGSDNFVVTVYDGNGGTDTISVNVTIQAVNDAPVAMSGVNPTSGTTTNEFYFWGTDSTDPDGTIVAYTWQINGALVSTNAEFLYTFATGGTYTVALTVRDNAGASDSDSVVVNVSEAVRSAVSVTVSDAVAGEPGLAEGTGKFTISRSGDLTQAITVKYAMGGTSSNGVDYTKLSGAVSLAAGKASASVTLTPLPDALAEGDETAILTLLPGTGYAVDGANTSGTVTIKDQTYGKPVVTAVATDSTAAEPGLTVDKGAIKVSRTGSCHAALTVQATLGGTALNGVDYTTITVPVTLAVGQSSKVLTIAPLADGVVEP